MSLRVVVSPYGRAAAAEALRTEIVRAKPESPLAPVTVVVPGNSVGVAARRLLASGSMGPISPAGPGLIGVTFLTTYRLAELLAAPQLAAAARRPVSTPVVAAAIRRVLAADPGPMFRRVAAHPATEEALVGAHRELSDLDDPALSVLADQSARAREVVRIHRLVKAQLVHAWYDEHDLMHAAHEIVEAGTPLLAELGTVLCHLPQRISGPSARLLRSVAARVDLVVIAGITGVVKADAAVVASVRRLGGEITGESRESITPPHGTSVCSVSDADDEVRVVVRGIVDAMRAGVPLEGMAVIVGNDDPYARLLHEHLELAGIADNGVSVRTLADSVLGRSLLRMLALPDHDFRREDVFALLAGVPLLDRHGREVPAVRWERISRDAGVVSGASEWAARIDHYIAELPEAGDGPDPFRARRDGARALAEFVEELSTDLAAAPATWSALADWAHRLIRRWIGTEDRRSRWSEFEQEAARRVEAAIDRLGALDVVESGPTLEVFRRSLALELEAARDRVGRLGEGVLVGSATLALGVELERVWVCGLAEGVFPVPPRDDPLVADADRDALEGDLPKRSDRVVDDQRALLAALSGTVGERVMCFPRGDLRRSTEHVPSRFLLDTIEALSGARPLGGDLPVAPWLTEIPSFVHGLTHAAFPSTRHELDVRAALARDPRLEAVPEIARGLELARARRSADFTRFDGNLTHLRDRLAPCSPIAPGVKVSATRLETWARCPHAYFVRYVLGINPIERPEEIVQIKPIDRGNVVHEVLERFLGELIGVAGVGRPWTDEHRARLHVLLEESFAGVEARGAAGRRLLWQRSCRQLHAQLDGLLDYDSTYRAGTGAETIATELGFGRAGSEHPAIDIKCSDGTTVHIVGSIDRVDRLADGRLAVIDYKSGSTSSYTKLTPEDPLIGGKLLQLPIYAHAARTYLGADGDGPVDAKYWFVLREPDRPRGYVVDDAIVDALDRALQIIVAGIDREIFVARPPEPGWQMFVECPYCDPDALGTTDTHRGWLRKLSDPELADYLELIGVEGNEANP